MSTDPFAQTFRRTWWALVIRGAFAIVLGVFILARPLESVAAFALVVALWALFSGITEIVHSFDVQPFFGSWWLLLLGGLVSVAFGIAALYYYPGLSLAFAVTWTSFWLMFTGILGVASAVQQKRAGLPWGWVAAWGVVSIGASIVAFVSPPVTLAAIMGLIAAFALVSGCTLLVGAYRLKTLESDVRRQLHPPVPA